MNTVTKLAQKALAALEQNNLCHVQICLEMLVAAAPMYWLYPDNADVVAMMYDEAKQEGLIDKGYYAAYQTQPQPAVAGNTTDPQTPAAAGKTTDRQREAAEYRKTLPAANEAFLAEATTKQ
jgi:hypothetical protein